MWMRYISISRSLTVGARLSALACAVVPGEGLIVDEDVAELRALRLRRPNRL